MALGSAGSGLAYHGINNAIVIEFDCWQDSGKNDVNYNHISINVKSGAADSNDAFSVSKQANPPNFSVIIKLNYFCYQLFKHFYS
jgi:hypothetical protein